MPAAVRTFRVGTALAGAGFRRYATYRQATAAGAFTNTVFGVIKLSILLAVAREAGGVVAGYDAASLSTYTWITQGLIAAVWMFSWLEVANRVKTGDIAIDLARPVHPIAAWLAQDLGRAGQACLFRFAVPMIAGGLVFGLRAPTRWDTVPLFAASALLGIVISFSCRAMTNLVAFWLTDVRGLVNLYMVVSTTLSGLLVPLPFLPGWAITLAYLTPFPWMLQVPSDIAVERRAGLAALGAVGVGACWAVALLAAASWMLSRGTRKLVVQGG